MLEKYAELIVKQGVNVQPGQDVVITSDVCNANLVKAIAKEAYKVGARDVIPYYVDEDLTRLRYDHNDVDYFKNVPNYVESKNLFVQVNIESKKLREIMSEYKDFFMN